MNIVLDLEEIEPNDWGQTVADLIRDELEQSIRRRVQSMLRNNPQLKKYMGRVQKQVFDRLMKEAE